MKIEFGQKITDSAAAGKKDAVHVPVIGAVFVGTSARAGNFVRFTDDSYTKIEKTVTRRNAHGIIDPFLDNSIHYGDKVWVMLVPNATKNLTHVYELTFEDVPEAPPPAPEAYCQDRDYADGCQGCW